jgi:regulator of sigma E protease
MLNEMMMVMDMLPVLLGAGTWLGSFANNVYVWGQVALGLGFVIFVHELGHFLAAKTFGVKCEKFYVGFDFPISIGPIRLPKSLAKFQWGETEYGIGILPLGGYVKMLGQDDDPRNAEEETRRSHVGDGPNAALDPRSYQAKKVWQRMIIISAGVIMNVIFAVLLAATAFFFGVHYTPSVVGDAVIGGPAWAAGIQPGDRIVRVANMGSDQAQLRFEEMATKIIVQGFRTQDAAIPVVVERDGQRLEYEIQPSNRFRDNKKIYTIGVREATEAKLSMRSPIAPFSYLQGRNVDLQPGDRVVAVDGQTLPIDAQSGKVLGSELTARLQARWNQPVELTLQRGAGPRGAGSPAAETASEVTVTLPPTPAKWLGLGFAMGAVVTVQTDSPAAVAGVRPGDVIEAVDGVPVVDAIRLPMLVAEKHGQPVELLLRRVATAGAEAAPEDRVRVTVTAEGELRFPAISESAGILALPGLGLAYSVQPTVAAVDPSAEKAAESVQPGDVLVQFQLEPTTAEAEAFKDSDFAISTKANVIDEYRTLPTLFASMQALPEGLKLRCFFKRNGTTREVLLPIVAHEGWYSHQRGIALTPLQDLHQTQQLGTALYLGLLETGRRLNDVFDFLRILVTGRASAQGLAGPIGIAQVAASEASQSPSRLLLFLTLLSANLAILNLLPIPALDGGHLMFLTAEAVRGKPVSEALQVRLTMLGVLLLLGLMVFAVFNDVLRNLTT